jgi:hypothetical protein
MGEFPDDALVEERTVANFLHRHRDKLLSFDTFKSHQGRGLQPGQKNEILAAVAHRLKCFEQNFALRLACQDILLPIFNCQTLVRLDLGASRNEDLFELFSRPLPNLQELILADTEIPKSDSDRVSTSRNLLVEVAKSTNSLRYFEYIFTSGDQDPIKVHDLIRSICDANPNLRCLNLRSSVFARLIYEGIWDAVLEDNGNSAHLATPNATLKNIQAVLRIPSWKLRFEGYTAWQTFVLTALVPTSTRDLMEQVDTLWEAVYPLELTDPMHRCSAFSVFALLKFSGSDDLSTWNLELIDAFIDWLSTKSRQCFDQLDLDWLSTKSRQCFDQLDLEVAPLEQCASSLFALMNIFKFFKKQSKSHDAAARLLSIASRHHPERATFPALADICFRDHHCGYDPENLIYLRIINALATAARAANIRISLFSQTEPLGVQLFTTAPRALLFILDDEKTFDYDELHAHTGKLGLELILNELIRCDRRSSSFISNMGCFERMFQLVTTELARRRRLSKESLTSALVKWGPQKKKGATVPSWWTSIFRVEDFFDRDIMGHLLVFTDAAAFFSRVWKYREELNDIPSGIQLSDLFTFYANISASKVRLR